MATQTTSIAHLGLKRFAGMPMAMPLEEEQTAIARALGNVDACVRLEKRILGAKVAARSALMSSLLTGELRVTPDESTP